MAENLIRLCELTLGDHLTSLNGDLRNLLDYLNGQDMKIRARVEDDSMHSEALFLLSNGHIPVLVDNPADVLNMDIPPEAEAGVDSHPVARAHVVGWVDAADVHDRSGARCANGEELC